MHSRLNFGQFQKERKQRQKRRALFWIVGISSAILLVAALSKTGTLDRLVLDSRDRESNVETEALRKAKLTTDQVKGQAEAAVQKVEQLQPEITPISVDKGDVAPSVRAVETADVDPKLAHISADENPVSANSATTDQGAGDGRALVKKEVAAEAERGVQPLVQDEVSENEEALEVEDEGVGGELATNEPLSKTGGSVGADLQWLPVHSAILGGNEDGSYRSLNSIQIGVKIPVVSKGGVRVLIAPNYLVNRYQFQYEYSWEGEKYAPGSVVGYRESNSGYEPILSDTVRGTFTRTVRSNGQISELFLPMEAHWTLYSAGPLHVDMNALTGVRIRTGAMGQWNGEAGMLPVELMLGTQGRISPMIGAGVEAAVGMEFMELFVRGQSMYIGTNSPYEKRARYQMGVGLRARF